MKPDNADFGITIDFDRGSSDPVRVFSAMTEMLRAAREMNLILIGAVDPDLVPVMVLEDVEAASITSWMKNKIKALDDQALKEFDIKQQVGKYAVKAKYHILEYLDQKEVENEKQRLHTLKGDLEKLAREQKVRQLPLPAPVNMDRLIKPMDQIQDAKKLLGPKDSAAFKSEDHEHQLNKDVTKRISGIPVDAEDQDTNGHMDMVLLVRKPDLIGDAQWEFRHGKQPVFAHILDDTWLHQFRRGEEIIVPGSYMSCNVGYTHKYTPTGALVGSSYDVVKVHEVLPPDGSLQLDMLGD